MQIKKIEQIENQNNISYFPFNSSVKCSRWPRWKKEEETVLVLHAEP